MNDATLRSSTDGEEVSRRHLISGIALTAAAGAVIPSAEAATASNSVQRMSAPKGLAPSMNNGQPIYSHVVVTKPVRTIYVAGQLSLDVNGNIVGKGDIRAQLRQVLENIKAALAAVGATLDDVVQTQTFVTDWNEYRKAIDVRQEYLGKVLPTSTTVQVSGLALSECMVEINAIAVRDS